MGAVFTGAADNSRPLWLATRWWTSQGVWQYTMVGGRCGLAVLSGLVHATPHPCWCHLEIHLHADEESGRVVAKKCRDRLVTEVVSQTLGKRGHVWVGINSLRPRGIWLQSRISKFQTHMNDKYLKYFLWNCYQVNASTPHWSLVNIGSGNGLMPSGNKPLPEPMLT